MQKFRNFAETFNRFSAKFPHFRTFPQYYFRLSAITSSCLAAGIRMYW